MAFNAKYKLQGNIEAIRIALTWDGITPMTDQEVEKLKRYAGFGGIKAILYPADSVASWKKFNASKEDLKLHPLIMQLHDLLKSHLSEDQYKEAVDSLRDSVLTAFYTPLFVPETIYSVMNEYKISPIKIYDPSAGAGIFITEAVKEFKDIQTITAVEKDWLTGKVLTALSSQLSAPVEVHIKGFEETPVEDNGTYDLVVSNIPFGNFPVYDKAFPDKDLSGKIHNYFFAKGLDKLAEGGIMAFITTDSFLHQPSNKTIREYLFNRADFVSLTVMPDNLMKDTGNTEAPSHLLIVQKNTAKKKISDEESWLAKTGMREHEFGRYPVNFFIATHDLDVVMGNVRKPGTDQYGSPTEVIWQDGDISEIRGPLYVGITNQLERRFNATLFKQAQDTVLSSTESVMNKLTYLPMPAVRESGVSRQLGLFENETVLAANRAVDYLSDYDQSIVQKDSAQVLSTIRTLDYPEHETLLLVTALAKNSKRFVYKLYSNAGELTPANKWLNAESVNQEIDNLRFQLKQFDHQYLYEGDTSLETVFGLNQKNIILTTLPAYYKDGTLMIHEGKVGKISDIEGQPITFQPLLHQTNLSFYKEYIALRDQYLKLSQKEFSGGSIQIDERESLYNQYIKFTDAFGFLNRKDNKKLILQDKAFGLVVLSSLERREREHFVKADILQQSVMPSPMDFHTDNPLEALARCLNEKGGVDLAFIQRIIEGSEDTIITQLEKHIYFNPGTNLWETADKYLSGNVMHKLTQAEKAVAAFPDNEHYKRSLEAIKEVQPEPIPFELLDFNLGERWIPIKYYERYASELFDTDVTIKYFISRDLFKVTTKKDNIKVTVDYGIKSRDGYKMYGNTLFEHALVNTTPFFTYKAADDKRLPDNESIQLGHQKIENIRNGFIEWLQKLPTEEKQALQDLYNSIFNCYVLRKYDGSHLTFPGLDLARLGIKDLYSSQKGAAWRIIQDRGALIDHEAGLGKTLVMIIAAMEMKRLGIAQKPMILSIKSNAGQIAAVFRQAYPHAKILFPDESDFNPVKRQRLFHEIKNNNWDCIILTHDQFSKIPQSPEVQRQICEIELANVEHDLITAKELGSEIRKTVLRGLQVIKKNLQTRLKFILSKIENKKDTDISFKEMNIDHLFVDESHRFKNLTFTTRHARVAGLGNTKGSQRSLNMLFAVRTLQERFDADLCVTFLSGTPISNSLTEMYLIFKYLRPKEMRRQGIENFDAWAAVFARKTVDFEFSVTNEIIAKERFRHFIKVPELAMFYNEIADYKTAQHIQLDKPALKEILINIKPTADQAEFIEKLMAFARTGDGSLIDRGKLSADEDKGRMLLATNAAKKMAVDMRLINEWKYPDDPGNKINIAAQNIAPIYKESAFHKGTQLVFCDIGTPKPRKFNVYDALKEKLIQDFNIPPHEVVFIHDSKWKGKNITKLFQKTNDGEIRVLIGSTEKLGTGNNVQQRVVALHHIDIPWKPSEWDQRNFRGARQGNQIAKQFYNNEVRGFIYGVEQSLDTYKFSLLKNKQTFISQMKNCELHVRTIDEGAIDEASGMNFSEYIAILSGDTSLLEKSKLEKKVAVLESLKNAHYKEIHRTKLQLERRESSLEFTEKKLASVSADEEAYTNVLQFDKDGTKLNPIKLIELSTTDPVQIGNYIIGLHKTWKPLTNGIPHKIGTLYGFDLYINQERRAVTDEMGMPSILNVNFFYAERATG